MSDINDLLREISAEHQKHPHGPPATDETRRLAGEACVRLCNGNPDLGRTLWKMIVVQLRYMPEAAAVALLYASNTDNLVPDIPPPDLDGPR